MHSQPEIAATRASVRRFERGRGISPTVHDRDGDCPRAGYPGGVRALPSVILAFTAFGCHIASGIDDLKIDRRVAEVPPEDLACDPIDDDFPSIDGDQWDVIEGGGITVSHDDAIVTEEAIETGAVISLDDTEASARGGLITVGKLNFNLCTAVVEIDPNADVGAETMIALLENPDDEVPLVALRKVGSQLVATRRGEELSSIPFNADQRFWRIDQRGEQILMEYSERGMGLWETVGAVTKPDQVRSVHVGLLVTSESTVATDEAFIFRYQVE
jgi:hypothetical protein